MGTKGLKLLAGLGVLVSLTKTTCEWLGTIDGFVERVDDPVWMDTVFTFLTTPSPTFNFIVFSLSLSFLSILLYHEKRKRETSRYRTLPHISDLTVSPFEKTPTPAPPSTISEVSKQRLDEEWDGLDEGDREIAREIVNQGGLMEPDIIALLKARGCLPFDGAYEPISDRVSFIQCDYVGYHSIVPGYQSLVEEKIAEEYGYDRFSR